MAQYWSRFRSWLRQLFGPLPAVPAVGPGTVTERREPRTSLSVLADGDVYEFEVHPVSVWSSTGLSRLDLRNRIDRYRSRAERDLARRLGDWARRYPPHQAYELERALNKDLASQDFRYGERGGTVSCRMQVRVRLDERVREAMLPFQQKRIELECEHAYGLRKAELLRKLITCWADTLRDLHANPFVAYAARLSADELVAAVVGDLVTARREELMDLHRLLHTAIRDYQRLGIGGYDWAVALEGTLRKHLADQGFHGDESRGEG